MRYIRTKDGVYEIERYYEPRDYYWVKQDCDQPIGSDEIIKQSNAIEDLIDVYVYIDEGCFPELNDELDLMQTETTEIFGAIVTDKGIIYVAQLNDKGELELL